MILTLNLAWIRNLGVVVFCQTSWGDTARQRFDPPNVVCLGANKTQRVAFSFSFTTLKIKHFLLVFDATNMRFYYLYFLKNDQPYVLAGMLRRNQRKSLLLIVFIYALLLVL